MKSSCYTYFTITGQFDPDEITRLLDLTPFKQWRAGDKRPNGGDYEFSRWSFGKCEKYDYYVDRQMKATLAPLVDKIDVLNHIRETMQAELTLVVVPHVKRGDLSPVLAPDMDVIDFCHLTRTNIDIDLYIEE